MKVGLACPLPTLATAGVVPQHLCRTIPGMFPLSLQLLCVVHPFSASFVTRKDKKRCRHLRSRRGASTETTTRKKGSRTPSELWRAPTKYTNRGKHTGPAIRPIILILRLVAKHWGRPPPRGSKTRRMKHIRRQARMFKSSRSLLFLSGFSERTRSS